MALEFWAQVGSDLTKENGHKGNMCLLYVGMGMRGGAQFLFTYKSPVSVALLTSECA